MRDGRSILAQGQRQDRKMQAGWAPTDARRLDEYFTSVRELSGGGPGRGWSRRPRAPVNASRPGKSCAAEIVGRGPGLMFDLITWPCRRTRRLIHV